MDNPDIQDGSAKVDEHTNGTAVEHGSESRDLTTVEGETAHDATDAGDDERTATKPLHAMQVTDLGDGTHKVDYLGRNGEEKSAVMPAGHGVLENFHRAMEAYWSDLEGAATVVSVTGAAVEEPFLLAERI